MKKSTIIPALITASMLVPTSLAFADSPLDKYDPFDTKKIISTEFSRPVSDIMKIDTGSVRFIGKDDGYDSVFAYYDDLAAKKEEAAGLGDAIVDAYSSIITEEEREKVHNLATRMETALTIKNYEEDKEALDEVIAELDKRKPIISRSYSGGGSYYSQGGSGVLTRSGGVNWFNGRRETWYSQRVLPGGGLRIPGRYVHSDGTIRDADGYICVAASDLPYGSIVETSLGTGKVYDTGCAAGTTDIYTNW